MIADMALNGICSACMQQKKVYFKILYYINTNRIIYKTNSINAHYGLK